MPEGRALPGRWTPWAALPVVAVAGFAVERSSAGWADVRVWSPDLVVGLVAAVSSLVAWTHRRGPAVLLGLVAASWFLGTLAPSALFLHVGVLIHLLVTYPGWRPLARTEAVAVAGGYAVALAMPFVQSDVGLAVVALGLVAVLARVHLSGGRIRSRHDRVALLAGGVLTTSLFAGAVLRTAVPDGRGVPVALLVYEAAVCAITLWLAWALRRPGVDRVTDLVVELGDVRSGTVRDALARALGDPGLELGYRTPDGGWLDARGNPVVPPAPGGDRAATVIDRAGRPFALLVHGTRVLTEPALVAAVASATRLTESNGALRHEVDARSAELRAARRRLLRAADEERARLERRLRDGAGCRLAALDDLLRRAAQASPAAADRVAAARQELAQSREGLDVLAQGLRPSELDAGLCEALTSLASRCPLRVVLDVPAGRYGTETEAAAWFVCAEAATNAVRYARAGCLWITVTARDGVLAVSVRDDGVGGADPAGGTGLRGLADRVEALGGRLLLESAPGEGTRLAAELLLDRRPV